MTRVAITKDSLSPLLEIFIWLCLVISVITVLVRLATKRYTVQRVDLDDYLIFVSLVLASAQSITISVATSNGVGKRLNSLTTYQLCTLLKAQYAASFLSITSICIAKLSLVAFLRNLTPLPFDRKFGLVIGLLVVVWAVTAIVTLAFQCHMPKPWDYVNQSCFNRTSWANYVATMNILTDFCLIALPLTIVARLKAANSKKIILTLFFIARVCVITAVVCQMVYLNRIKHSSDLTFEIWPVTLCTQVVQCLSILTTCLVYLRPFLDSLETGFIQIGDLRRQHVPGFGYRPEEGSRSTKETRNEDTELQDNARPALHDLGNTASSDTVQHEWDAHSRSHILRTTTLTVEEERYRENHSLPPSPSTHFVHTSEGSR